MKKKKKWRTGIALQPAHRGFSHLAARPFTFSHGCDLVVKIERAVVDIEATAQSKTPVQNEACHESRCPVPGILQDSGQCDGRILERDAIILHSVSERICGRE